LAVAPVLTHARAFPGHTLTAASTAADYLFTRLKKPCSALAVSPRITLRRPIVLFAVQTSLDASRIMAFSVRIETC